MLKMQVTELDGLEIAPFNFSTTFTQTNPRKITIDNAAVVNHVHKLPHENSESTQTSLQGKLHAKIHDLDVLRIKARQLENAIISQENKIAELLGQKKPSSIQDCDNLECVLEGLGEKFRDAAEKLGGDVEELKEFIAHSRDESLPVPPEDYEYWFDDEADDNKAEEYDLKKHAGKWTWADQMPLNGEAVDIKVTHPPRQPPVSTSPISYLRHDLTTVARHGNRTIRNWPLPPIHNLHAPPPPQNHPPSHRQRKSPLLRTSPPPQERIMV